MAASMADWMDDSSVAPKADNLVAPMAAKTGSLLADHEAHVMD